MTLLDAPSYDPAKARRRRNLLIAGLVACLVLAGFLWWFWDWPQEHRVNQFFAHVEAKDLPKAFGIWNHDPDWQQHPQQYAQYPYGRFETDWGHSSDWGDIKTHKILMAKTVGLRSGRRGGSERTKNARLPLGGAQDKNYRLLPGAAFDGLGSGYEEPGPSRNFPRLAGSSTCAHFWLRSICRNKPAEHFARTDLNKACDPLSYQQLHGLRPANRAGDLTNQSFAQRCPR